MEQDFHGRGGSTEDEADGSLGVCLCMEVRVLKPVPVPGASAATSLRRQFCG